MIFCSDILSKPKGSDKCQVWSDVRPSFQALDTDVSNGTDTSGIKKFGIGK